MVPLQVKPHTHEYDYKGHSVTQMPNEYQDLVIFVLKPIALPLVHAYRIKRGMLE